MNFSPSASANTVTCFMGTAFLLALLGGFLSDSYLTTYCIYVISAITQLLGLLILTLQAHSSSLQPPVLISATRNRRATPSSRPTRTTLPNTTFLDRAISDPPGPHDDPQYSPWLHCTVSQVEDSKSVLRTLPIFASTVMLNCCLAQLSTFSVQQAATMDTRLVGTTFRVPPASLPVFPVLFVLILAPVYNHVILPFFSRRDTGSEPGITHLQRIGTGLGFSVLAMATAALVETKRKRAAARSGLAGSTEPIPITFLWVALQYLFLGSADLFSLAGQMEFFFSEAPAGMRSLATSLSWASLAVGYYLSSVLVGLVNWATGRLPGGPWLRGSNLNRYRLERFYWLMCGLSGLNLLQYVFWARRYRYRAAAEGGGGGGRGEEEDGDEGGA
ncbi:Protein NRT1/ PTR FAMILY 4.6 [Striga hermonthica]|uniref:Protein NRT1/ PTR FAMILY 4.6 n=1 Tax=Striga hermonthica TaxID=68872 RepID=A0A9N7RLM3_STRHE|nr:Protein NRT1/ PTR FAMILY 4.6 [Striga hermonthica]